MATKQDGEENGRDTIKLSGPGGLGAEFKGRHVPNLLRFLIFLLLALLFALGYSAIAENSKQHDSLKHTIEAQAQAQQEITYIMTLTPEERATLKLSMPDSLRKRLR